MWSIEMIRHLNREAEMREMEKKLISLLKEERKASKEKEDHIKETPTDTVHSSSG